MALAMMLTEASASAAVVRRLVHEPTTFHAAIYRTVCHGCHMAEAQGAVGAGAYPALADDPKLAAAGYPVLVNGSKGMPAFGALLDDEQVAAVVTTFALISATLTRTAFRRPT
jgi:cytochrome c5